MTSTVYIVERALDYEKVDEVAAYSDEALADAHALRENRKQHAEYLAGLRSEIEHWSRWVTENPASELQRAVFEIQAVAEGAKTPGPRRAARAVLETLPRELTNMHDVNISIAQMRAMADEAEADPLGWMAQNGHHSVYRMVVSDTLQDE